MSESIHFLIVADDPLARAALAAAMRTLPGAHINAQMSHAMATAAAIHAQSAGQIDVIIWDLGWETAVDDLPAINSIGIPIIFLLAEIEQVTQAWTTAGRAILLRELDPERIFAAAQAVLEGLIVISPTIAPKLLSVEPTSTEADYDSLTPRELQVLHHLAEGLTNKAIAQQLEISNHTVKFHVNAILNKLHAQSRTEAVVRATRQGLIAL